MDAIIIHDGDDRPNLELRLGDIEYDCWLDLSDTDTQVYWKFRRKSTSTILASGKCSKLYGGSTGYVLLSWEDSDLDSLTAGSYEIEICVCFSVSTGSITGATKASPCVITSAGHGLTTGDEVYISGVTGMTDLNDEIYTITKIDADTFSLDSIDSSDYDAYISGGTWEKLAGKQTANKYFLESEEDTNWDNKSLPIKVRADF